MLPPRAEKKRLVSRPLSPTHKRHKLAQYAQQTQASSRLNTLLLSPKQTSEDISPDLQFSQSDDSTKRRKVPHASALTHKLEIRSRPLRPEVNYKAVETRNTNSRPLLPYQSPVSDTPVHHHHMSNVLEEKQPRADSSKAANASTKAGLPQAQRTHWFWASEMPAIRDHILRARKERAKAARTKPVQTAGTPTSPSSFRPAVTAQTVLPSPELSVSPSLPCALSPLDLGSPDSVDEFQMNLRSVRVRTGERPMTDQDHLDHSLVTTSASPKARTVPKFSVQRGSFDRSSCPSPDPPPRYEESNHKGLRSSTKTTDPAPTTTSCNGSISESVSTCKDTKCNQEKCPSGFRNDLDQTKSKMTMPHLPRALNRVYDRPHSTSLGAGRNAPILSCEVQVRSRNPPGACSAWAGCYRGHQHCTGAWDAKSKHPLLHSWNEASGQFQAPEPLIVFSVTMNDATIPVISVNRDGEVNNAGAETSNQQRETSNPRNVPEEPTAHVQRGSDDGLNSLQGTSDPPNISEEPNAQVPAPSRDGEPMEPFPNMTESLLRYSESTTNAVASSSRGCRGRRTTTVSSDDGDRCCLPCFRRPRHRRHVIPHGGPIALVERQVESRPTTPAPRSDFQHVGYTQEDQTEKLSYEGSTELSAGCPQPRSIRNKTANTTGESSRVSTGASTAPTAVSPHQQQIDQKSQNWDKGSPNTRGGASGTSRSGSAGSSHH